MVDLSDCRNADSGSNIFHFKKIIPAKNQTHDITAGMMFVDHPQFVEQSSKNKPAFKVLERNTMKDTFTVQSEYFSSFALPFSLYG